jgi:hypothetical protein
MRVPHQGFVFLHSFLSWANETKVQDNACGKGNAKVEPSFLFEFFNMLREPVSFMGDFYQLFFIAINVEVDHACGTKCSFDTGMNHHTHTQKTKRAFGQNLMT